MGQQYFPIHINHPDSHTHKKIALKTNLRNLFSSLTLPTTPTTANTCSRRREPRKPGSQGWALLPWPVHSSRRCRPRSLGCPRPRAKNDSRPAKFNGSCVLTNWANLNRQNSFLARGHTTVLNAKARCPLRCAGSRLLLA